MTLEEASKRFCLEIAHLHLYEEKGLLTGEKAENGTVEYSETELQKAVQLYFLEEAGVSFDVLKQYAISTEKGAGAAVDRVRILRKCRYQLLDEIHQKQQSLDRVDYLIHKIKNQSD